MVKKLVFPMILFVGLILAVGARAQTEYPAGLAGVLPVYPGMKIMEIREHPLFPVIEFMTEDQPRLVGIVFKKILLGQGWDLIAQRKLGRGMRLIFNKGEKQLRIYAGGLARKPSLVKASLHKL